MPHLPLPLCRNGRVSIIHVRGPEDCLPGIERSTRGVCPDMRCCNGLPCGTGGRTGRAVLTSVPGCRMGIERSFADDCHTEFTGVCPFPAHGEGCPGAGIARELFFEKVQDPPCAVDGPESESPVISCLYESIHLRVVLRKGEGRFFSSR